MYLASWILSYNHIFLCIVVMAPRFILRKRSRLPVPVSHNKARLQLPVDCLCSSGPQLQSIQRIPAAADLAAPEESTIVLYRCWLPMLAFLNLQSIMQLLKVYRGCSVSAGAMSFCQSQWWLPQARVSGSLQTALLRSAQHTDPIESSLGCHCLRHCPFATDTGAHAVARVAVVSLLRGKPPMEISGGGPCQRPKWK